MQVSCLAYSSVLVIMLRHVLNLRLNSIQAQAYKNYKSQAGIFERKEHTVWPYFLILLGITKTAIAVKGIYYYTHLQVWQKSNTFI
jgi:hypothetical protein